MKYIVETLGVFRQMHVVEAANKEEALAIAEKGPVEPAFAIGWARECLRRALDLPES